MPFSTVRVIAMLVVMTAGVWPAYSQALPPPRQPSSGGLFGATRAELAGRDKLNFTFQAAQGWDSQLPVSAAQETGRGAQANGPSTRFQALADFRHDAKRFGLSGSASTAFAYYGDLDRFDPIGHNASVGVTIDVPKGTLQLRQMAAFSPSYLYQLFPIDPALETSIPIYPDYRIAQVDSLSYGTTADLSFGSARGIQFTVSGAVNRSEFEEQALAPQDLKTYNASARLSRRVTSRASFSAGYSYATGDFESDGATDTHAVTLGVDYTLALSRTRKLMFHLEVSPTLIQLPVTVADAPIEGEPQTYSQVDTDQVRLSSEISVSYPFRRNWNASARYRRSTEFLSVLGQPTFSDGARVELTGQISRRVDVAASAGYVEASSFYSASQALDSYTGQVSARYALSRMVAVSGEYLYYYYDRRMQAAFGPELPPTYEQHGVRAGVVVFLEAFGR